MQNNFAQDLATFKSDINVALNNHSQKIVQDAQANFTLYSHDTVDAYCQVLGRGGKRMRGALTIVGYQMSGGNDYNMIIQAACAIEMIHAYILVLDDIMDRSAMRRGGQSAHALLADYHKQHSLSGDSSHFGEAVAINAALIGCHYAQTLVTQLNAPAEQKLDALRLLNEALIVTGHGQINDIFNEAVATVNMQEIDQVLEWKTAHYSFLNPLQFGMALAGAKQQKLEAIKPFCLQAGRAFQITDDILGIFGAELEAGKNPMDDIREGKRTVLTSFALKRASNEDAQFLQNMLGRHTISQSEFERCKQIIEVSGAHQAAIDLAETYIQSAQQNLSQAKAQWSADGVEFLSSLVSSMSSRRS